MSWREVQETDVTKFLKNHGFEEGEVSPRYVDGDAYRYKGFKCMYKKLYVGDYMYSIFVTDDVITWEIQTPWRSLMTSGVEVCYDDMDVEWVERNLDRIFD